MKYRFTNATLSAKRKGKEVLAPTHTNHPMRESVILSPDAPMASTPAPKMAKAVDNSQETERLRQAVEQVLGKAKKKTVPKSRILSLANPGDEDNTKEIHDVLAMLVGKK